MKDLIAPLMQACASSDSAEASKARGVLIQAIAEPIRKGVFDGPVLYNTVFDKVSTNGDRAPRFDIHFVVPGTEANYAGYAVPNCGMIPYRLVEGDEVSVPTYRIANSIDTCMHYIKNARWDVVEGMVEALRAGIVHKLNKDAGNVLMYAAADRGIVVVDSQAAQGQFTQRLVNLLHTAFARNGGGNSTSMGGSRLTDLFISPEAMANIRSWNTDQVDDITRREIWTNNGLLARIWGVNIHVLYELGVGAYLQNFAEDTLNVSMPTNGSDNHQDVELVLGLDLSRSMSFVMPVSEDLKIYEDNLRLREGKWGLWCDMYPGFAVLDPRSIMFGSF